jgi:hypothetical protein
MLSEQKYREVVGDVLNKTSWVSDNAAAWNNDFILSLAIHGLCLLPIEGNALPFPHYIQAPRQAQEKGGTVAWGDSWIVDGDYKDHLKQEAAKFTFTPLKKN